MDNKSKSNNGGDKQNGSGQTRTAIAICILRDESPLAENSITMLKKS